MNKEDFYQYRMENCKPLRFGTSGLRDEDIKLIDMQIYISTKGFLNYLFLKNIIKKASKIALAGDFRLSTPRILIAVSFAILDFGCDVDFCGRIPTPAVSLWGFHNKIPSIMVTASHNPHGQNGIKFVKPDGEVLKYEESFILDEISKVREEEYKKSFDDSIFTKTGSFKKFEELGIINQYNCYLAKKALKTANNKAKEFYIERYKKAFGKNLNGIKLVFFEQTCIGRDIIPFVLKELGAEIICVGRIDETKEFVPVDTENMKPAILERMANFAYENKCSVCITADGDSDRPAILYLKRGNDGKFLFKDNKLDYRFVKGDILNVLVSLFIKPDFIAVPIHINYRAYKVLLKNRIEVKITKVGSAYVIKASLDKLIDNPELKMYGFEANGGGIVFSKISVPGIFEIGPLPTRDSLFPIICTLIFSKIKNLSVEELVNEVFSRDNFSYCHSGLVENVPGISITLGCEKYNSDIGKKIVQILRPIKENISEVLYEEELVFKDLNGELISVEDSVIEHLVRISEKLKPYVYQIIEKQAKIKKINFLDGIKVYLENEEIIHFRPSGASAQFRIYIESPDEERAVRLVEKAVSGPSGGLVKFINDFIDGKINL